jgi:hypothetical protein
VARRISICAMELSFHLLRLMEHSFHIWHGRLGQSTPNNIALLQSCGNGHIVLKITQLDAPSDTSDNRTRSVSRLGVCYQVYTVYCACK